MKKIRTMNIKKHTLFLVSCLAYILLVNLTGLNWFYFGVLAIADHFYWHYINWTFWKKREPIEKKQRSAFGEWGNAITFAVIGATLIHTFIIQPFTIPTSSMEKSMLIGDYLLVSKLNYGPNVPNTPLSIPFMHNTFVGTKNTPSYSNTVQLGYNRLPGFGTVKNNDIVVFNYPVDDMQTDMPFDKKTHYVKRCVGIAGDSLEIRNQKVYINGDEQPLPDRSHGQYSYIVTTNGTGFRKKFLLKNEITEVYPTRSRDQFFMMLTDENVSKLKSLSNVISVENPQLSPKQKGAKMYPKGNNFNWSTDNYGPIYIPKAGKTIELNDTNIALYSTVIDKYEDNQLKIDSSGVYINYSLATDYTFKMNYYWMMGDNRHNSLDSRFWGFVPENHVVGKPVFNWLSIDPNNSGIDKIRWDRLFTVIHGEGESRSYLIHFLIFIALWNLIPKLMNKRKN